MLDAADESAAVTITLPAVTNLPLNGTTYKFYVKDASNGGFVIRTGDRTDGTGDLLAGSAVLVCAQVSNTTNGANGRVVIPDGSNDNTITLDRNGTNGGGSEGTIVTITNITSSLWFVEGIIHTIESTSNGTGIFSDTAA